MSSFKRKISSKQANLPTGTRPCPSSSSTLLTSTGIPSLDDILGGGLPLSCTLLTLAPDHHTLYGELVQKYFITQGLACGQNVCVVDGAPKLFVQECMWIPPMPDTLDDDEMTLPSDRIKIAWRYAQMEKFQTTVSASKASDEGYCKTLDLTCRIPGNVVDGAFSSGQVWGIEVDPGSDRGRIPGILHRLEEKLKVESAASQTTKPTRICVPSLGSPKWGDLAGQDILRFLCCVKRLLRRYPSTCASIALPPHLSSDGWGGPGWIQKLGWLSDAAITVSAFSADLTSSSSFPSHHGLLHIHSLPAPHTILPPSDKFSALRGLSSSASSGGSGENNLAFKCTRKRLIFETLHLDVEGGVGERRTTPSTAATVMQTPGADAPKQTGALGGASAAVEVKMEGSPHQDKTSERAKTKLPKKVAFQSDRPDLYDF